MRYRRIAGGLLISMAPIRLPRSLDKQRRELTKLWLRFRVPILIGAVAIVALAAVAWFWQSWQASEQAAAGAVVAEVRAALAGSLSKLDAGLDLQALAEVVAAGDPGSIAEREQSLAATLPGVLGVRLLAERPQPLDPMPSAAEDIDDGAVGASTD